MAEGVARTQVAEAQVRRRVREGEGSVRRGEGGVQLDADLLALGDHAQAGVGGRGDMKSGRLVGGQDDPQRRPGGQLGAQACGDGLKVRGGTREEGLQLADQSSGGLRLRLAEEAQLASLPRRADQPDGVARARDEREARARLTGPAKGRLPVAWETPDAGKRRATVGQRDDPVQEVRMNGRAR